MRSTAVVDDPDNYDLNFTDRYKCMVMREAMRVSDLTVPDQYQGVVDLYDCSHDWIPIYDKSDLPGFYMAVRTSGNQYKNAPVVGTMMAELIDACEKGRDHDKDPFQFYLQIHPPQSERRVLQPKARNQHRFQLLGYRLSER